jgi:integrase
VAPAHLSRERKRLWKAVLAGWESLDKVADLCPSEDRGRERPVFETIGGAFRLALADACKLAGISHYHPHDLRHRRISLWFAAGIDRVAIAYWSGHSKPSMSSDVYGHVVVGEDEWLGFWTDARARFRVA